MLQYKLVTQSRLEDKTKSTSRLVIFVVPVDQNVKIKENKKRDKYLDFARELIN